MKLSQTNSKSTPGRGEDGHAPDRSVALHDKRVKRALVEGVVVSDLASQRHENRTEEDDYEGLVLTDQVLKSDGNDLTKKNHVRKPSRYLLVFNGLLKFADNLGKREVGVMTDLNTPNPSLTIGFPERGGSLRLLGTIVFPSTQYAVLNMEGKKSVVIEEIFDSMIVFSEAEWVDSDGVATREVDFPSRLPEASDDSGSPESLGGYRSGCTTGVPKTVRVKRRDLALKAAAAMETAGPHVQTIPALDDLEELDSEEAVFGDLRGSDEEDGSDDDSFAVGGKRKSRAHSDNVAARKVRPKRGQRRTAASASQAEVDSGDEGDGYDDFTGESSDMDESDDEDEEESDWSGAH